MKQRLASRSLTGSLVLAGAFSGALAGCGDAATNGDYQGQPRQLVAGSITSLSQVSADKSTYLAVQWFFDSGSGDEMYTDIAQVADTEFPAKFRMALYDEPKQFLIDFDEAATRPTCGPQEEPEVERCWPADAPRPNGRGKIAIGALVVFDDLDGDGKLRLRDPDVSQADCDEDPDSVSCAEFKRTYDVLRGMSTSFLIYAKDLDAAAREELKEMGFPLNPEALKPGFNFARVRCAPRDATGDKDGFDKFEIIPEQEFTIESEAELDRRTDAGELCWNWT